MGHRAGHIVILLISLLSVFDMKGQTHNAVVADSTSRIALPGASIFDRNGNIVGICNSKGKMPYISPASYPVTVRFLGFEEKVISEACADTIFLKEYFTELPEVVVESRRHKVLHMLAYVREYSTLTTYSDTVFLFREKMVDYMLTPDKKIRFKGWRNPRILKCKSYSRFSNAQGLDSVSDKCNHHFSWSDWVGVVAPPEMSPVLRNTEFGSDTLRGKYSPTEIWTRNKDRLIINVDVMADTTSRRWVPNLSTFFRSKLDFENFKVRFNYGNIAGDSISTIDLTGYSFNIESNGRGHDMFMFHRVNEPFFVSTYAEVYILDKEYITVKEARKWERQKVNTADIEIYEPAEAPELQPSIQNLIARVNNVNHAEIRSYLTPDHRMIGRSVKKQNFGQRALSLLKTITGISQIRMHRNNNRQWRDFKRERILENKNRDKDD